MRWASWRWVASSLGWVVLSACLRQAGPERPAPSAEKLAPTIRIPAGCAQNLAGDYVHTENEAFSYLASDDGVALTLRLSRQSADGGWSEGAVDAGTSETTYVLLRRTPEGFIGATHAIAPTASGHPCAVTFPTEVIGCDETSITLRAASSVSVDDQCRAPSANSAPFMALHVLQRVRPLSSEGTTKPATAEEP